MGISDSPVIMENAISELTKSIRQELSKAIEDTLIDEFRERIKPEIRALVEGVAVKQLESYLSLLDMREHISIYVKWKGTPP